MGRIASVSASKPDAKSNMWIIEIRFLFWAGWGTEFSSEMEKQIIRFGDPREGAAGRKNN